MTGHFTSYETRTDHELATLVDAKLALQLCRSYAATQQFGLAGCVTFPPHTWRRSRAPPFFQG
jgi:hypothetical protein